MTNERAHLAGLRTVDLVEDADHPLAGGVRQGQRLPLRRLGGLPGGEHPDDGVGVAQEVARHPLVLGANRVQARRVDDLDAAKRLDGQEDLHHPDLAGVGVAQRGQKSHDVGGRDGAGRAVMMNDARLGRGAISKHVDRGGRGGDARRGDIRAAERVDEGRLPGVELAHHGDQQRTVERLGGASDRRGEADQRGRGAGELVRPGEKPGELPDGRRGRRARAGDEPAARLVRRQPPESQQVRLCGTPVDEGVERGGP